MCTFSLWQNKFCELGIKLEPVSPKLWKGSCVKKSIQTVLLSSRAVLILNSFWKLRTDLICHLTNPHTASESSFQQGTNLELSFQQVAHSFWIVSASYRFGFIVPASYRQVFNSYLSNVNTRIWVQVSPESRKMSIFDMFKGFLNGRSSRRHRKDPFFSIYHQDFASIIEGLTEEEEGNLFEDPEFPAENDSLFFSQDPPREIEWLRPSVSSTL